MMFWLLKIRFCIRFSAIAHLQKAPITASSEHVLVSQSSVYRLKQFHLKQNVLNAHIRKKYTLLNIIFVNKWNNVKNGKSVVKNHCKNVGLVLHLVIYRDFHGLKLLYLFFHCKVYYLRNKIM